MYSNTWLLASDTDTSWYSLNFFKPAATRKNVKGYVMYPSLISPLYGVSIE